jgi:hypothetical protein
MTKLGFGRNAANPCEATVLRIPVSATVRNCDLAADVVQRAAFQLDTTWMMWIANAVHYRHLHSATMCTAIPAVGAPRAHASAVGIEIRLVRGAAHLLPHVDVSRPCRDDSEHCRALLAPV